MNDLHLTWRQRPNDRAMPMRLKGGETQFAVLVRERNGRRSLYAIQSAARLRISSREILRISAARPSEMVLRSSAVRTKRWRRSSRKSYSETPSGSPARFQFHENSLALRGFGSSTLRSVFP